MTRPLKIGDIYEDSEQDDFVRIDSLEPFVFSYAGTIARLENEGTECAEMEDSGTIVESMGYIERGVWKLRKQIKLSLKEILGDKN